jgi:hypothetical protein
MEEKDIVQGNIGSEGGYKVHHDGKGGMRAEISYGKDGLKGGAFVELDVIAELRVLAKMTENQLDDGAVDMIEKFLKG